MSQQIALELRAAVLQAMAKLGERETRRIVEECLRIPDDEHWNPQRGGR